MPFLFGLKNHLDIFSRNSHTSPSEGFTYSGGVNILNDTDKEALQNLFDKLADYGLFVVPNGELES
jgi:hypothetical protein